MHTVGEELAGLEGIVVGYDDVEALAVVEPKVVEGERALFGRKSPGANKRAELGIVLDEPRKSWSHDLAVQKTAIVITSMPSLTVAVAMLKEREQTGRERVLCV
jgi:hypothetical protein